MWTYPSGPPFSRAYAMVPGPYTAYLDHEGPKDWSTFGHARVATHTNTHT